MLRCFVNSIAVYLLLVLLMRLVGKRQLGELEVSELIVTFLISELASQPILDPEVPLWRVFVPILTLMGMEVLLSFLSLKSVRFRLLLAGKPALLVSNGRIDQSQMRRNRITPEELAEAVRSQGILDMREVQYAVLETSGRLSIVPMPNQRAVTAAQLGMAAEDAGYPVMLIDCGRVLSDNLRMLGRDENWLMKKLRESGLRSPGEVYMMTADRTDGVFLVPREKKVR